jgi:ABC-type phosphate transport system ATPase subunit
VEGKPIPATKNWLRDNRSLGQRVQDAEVVSELLEHPGWAIVEEVAQATADRGAERLAKIAAKTALSTDPQQRLDFARSQGVQDAVSFFPDVVASILDSAKTAADELRNDATETVAEGTNS